MQIRRIRVWLALSMAMFGLGVLTACGSSPLDVSKGDGDPRVHVVCAQVITANCAREAAKLTGHAVAWIAVPTAQSKAALRVLKPGQVIETLTVGSNDVSIESPSMGMTATGTPSPVRWRAVTGIIRQEDHGGFALTNVTWSQYSVAVNLASIGDAVSRDDATRLASRVQFAKP